MNSRLFHFLEPFVSGLKTKGSFSQNLLLTFSGNAVSMALGFCFTPFIARIYGPEVYGVFALFIAIVTTLSPLSTLQFPFGFVASETQKEFDGLIVITVGVITMGTVSLLILIAFFRFEFLQLFDSLELLPFAYLIPLQFFFMGIDNLLLGWNIYNKEFGRGAKAKIFSVVGSKGLTLGWGLIHPTVVGMIVGNLLVYPFESAVKITREIRTSARRIFKDIRVHNLLAVFKKFRSYPFYVTPGSIINNFGSQLPIYLFAIYFENAFVGMFALANSLVFMPLSILINSSTTVFLQKAAELKQNSPKELSSFVFNLYKKLFITGLVPLVIFSLLSEWLFTLILGETWTNAGYFASFIAISAILSVVFLPLSVLFRILQKERLNFTLNVIFTIVKAGGLFLGILYQDVVLSLIGYCLASMLYYAVSLFYVFKIVDLNPLRLYRDVILIVLCFALIVFINGITI